jgi:hypothetical protein
VTSTDTTHRERDAGLAGPMPATEEIIDVLAEAPNVLTFKPSDSARNRVWELIDREKCGSLSEEEKYELDQYSQMEHLMRLVKARARRRHKPGT